MFCRLSGSFYDTAIQTVLFGRVLHREGGSFFLVSVGLANTTIWSYPSCCRVNIICGYSDIASLRSDNQTVKNGLSLLDASTASPFRNDGKFGLDLTNNFEVSNGMVLLR